MTEQPKIRVGPLTSVREVPTELSRLYKQARRKAGPDIGSAEAYRLASILSVMAKCLETSEFERRIAEMEAAILSVRTSSPSGPRRSRE
jgi:hypothetical protein